ncbi:hypothetical protein V2G26_009647 [Clonostachys chloroleuca]
MGLAVFTVGHRLEKRGPQALFLGPRTRSPRFSVLEIDWINVQDLTNGRKSILPWLWASICTPESPAARETAAAHPIGPCGGFCPRIADAVAMRPLADEQDDPPLSCLHWHQPLSTATWTDSHNSGHQPHAHTVTSGTFHLLRHWQFAHRTHLPYLQSQT